MSREVEADGRRFALREMDPADMLDLLEAAGHNAGNRAWLRFAMVVCSVQAIDGIPMPFPRDAGGIKALARTVGVNGIEAVRATLAHDSGPDQVALAKN
jgi:hypothetical protein